MIAVRATIQRALLSAYETANRRGWLDSRVAEVIFQRGYFAYKRLIEDPFAKLASARPEMFRGGDIIDVGANVGYTAALFARVVSADHRVHAFEPEERNFRWLTHVIEREGLGGRVLAHRAAVGAHDGTIELWHNASHHGDHRIATQEQRASPTESMQQVPITKLDTYLASRGWPPIAFIKIDVQGFEPEVLRGMHEMIERNRGLHVAIEFSPVSLEALGFAPAEFMRALTAALPHTAILERDGRLRDADADAVAAVTARNELGYVDLVCWR